MSTIIIAIALWILKVWIEHDPSQRTDSSDQPPLGEADNWYEYGI